MKLLAFTRWERWEMEEVDRLLKGLPRTHRDLPELRWIKRHADEKGMVEIRYHFADGLDFGRAYAKHGFQRVSKVTRARCAANHYVELDIANAFPTIGLQVMERNGLVCPHLADYNRRRKAIFQELLQEYPLWQEADLKRFYIIALHQGNYRKFSEGNTLEQVSAFQEEVHSNCRKLLLMDEFADLQGMARVQERSNPRGTVVSWICQRVEAKIMAQAECFAAQELKREVGTYIFDGSFVGQTPDQPAITPEELCSLSDFVFAKTGFRVSFGVKPLTVPPMPVDDYPRNCDDACRIVLFDLEGTLGSLDGKDFTPRPGITSLLQLKEAGFRVGIFTNRCNNRLPMKKILLHLPGLNAFDVVLTGEFCYDDADLYLQQKHEKKKFFRKRHLKQKPLSTVCSLHNLLLVDTEPLGVTQDERSRVRLLPYWHKGMDLNDDALPKLVDHLIHHWDDAPLALAEVPVDRKFWNKKVTICDHPTETTLQPLLPTCNAFTKFLCVAAGMGFGKTFQTRLLVAAILENKGISWRHNLNIKCPA